MRLVLSFVLICISALSFGQHTVICANGDTIYSQKMHWEHPVMSAPLLVLDSVKVGIDQVAEFGNDLHWFLNEDRQGESVFLRRTMECNLDLYMYASREDLFKYPLVSIGGNMRMNQSALPFSHYMRPDGMMREANYSNLNTDAGMFAVSAQALKEYKWLRVAQWSTALLGAGITAYSIGTNDFSPIFVLGLTMGGGSFFFEKPKKERLWQAATYYGIDAEPIE